MFGHIFSAENNKAICILKKLLLQRTWSWRKGDVKDWKKRIIIEQCMLEPSLPLVPNIHVLTMSQHPFRHFKHCLCQLRWWLSPFKYFTSIIFPKRQLYQRTEHYFYANGLELWLRLQSSEAGGRGEKKKWMLVLLFSTLRLWSLGTSAAWPGSEKYPEL